MNCDHCTPETKQQSKQLTAKAEPVPKNVKTVPSTNTAGNYCNSFTKENRENRPRSTKETILFHQDTNTSCHKSVMSMAKINRVDLFPNLNNFTL